ncbi:ogr/Delta-like zinc finger family protein [Serratia rubidaea]|uniref:ogr/Delta-like zinc finger family protein n=1 Tax=Serratia rubidaea TaxID=61652 RepID=UPI0024311402|nr:ogr/Delta-like zinc finger family protein [Serratia rubidaea]MCR0997659.1 ogr/Delta-like zinc finger family protein [Serratia rubidaea]
MFHCPLCQTAAHARTSRYLSQHTKERYHQCQNINCGHTFKTMETYDSAIMTTAVPPHPIGANVGHQQVMWM